MAEAPPVVGVIMIVTLISALGCGAISYIARTRWRNRRQTQLFAYLGIIFTLIFMLVTLPYVE